MGGRRPGALMVAVLLLSAGACTKRPAPWVAPNFDEHRPLRVAVLPTVFVPEKTPILQRVDVLARSYAKRLLNQQNATSVVLQSFDTATARAFNDLKFEVVP